MRLYHFTSRYHLPSIMASGVIRTTESNGDIRPGRDHARPDVVWLLDTPTTEGLNHGLTVPGTEHLPNGDKGAIRITVEVPRARVESWADWCKRHRVDDMTRSVLSQTAGGPQATSHWYVTERPIPKRWWVAVDDMKSGHHLGKESL